MVSVGGSQDSIDGADDLVPAVRLLDELRASLRREPVIARTPVVLGGSPERGDPSTVFEAVERWIQRAMLGCEHVFRTVCDRVCDRVAVGRTQGQSLEYQQIERALEKFSLHWVVATFGHAPQDNRPEWPCLQQIRLYLSSGTMSRRSWRPISSDVCPGSALCVLDR